MDREATIRHMQMLNDSRWRALAAAGDPPEGLEYPHASTCQHRADPPWEFDLDAQRWTSGPCGGVLECSIRQVHEPRAPAPPKPTDAELATWVHSFDGHPCPNVEPVIHLELEVLDGDQWPHWVGRCRVCHAINRWRSAAIAHYEQHGVKIGNRPPVRGELTW